MSYKFMPYVVTTSPLNMSVDVPTSTDISITFSTDMDAATLPGNIVVQTTSGGRKVDGTISYKDRVVTFTPSRSLDPATSYTVIVAGDSNIEDGKPSGVLSILGYPMAGAHVFTFTTAGSQALPSPVPVQPANLSVLNNTSVTFKWLAVENAVSYEIQAAAVPEMEPLLWNTVTTDSEVTASYSFASGNYFWRVRAAGSDGTAGEWSPVCSFAVDTAVGGEIGQVDDGAAGTCTAMSQPELVLPDGLFDVNPALESITIKLPFLIDTQDVRVRLVGRDISGDVTSDRGIVSVDTAVQSNGGITVITLTEHIEPGGGS